MKLAPLRLFIAVVLLGIFLAKGVVSISGLYVLLGQTTAKQELLMNAEEEKSEEKNAGKSLAEKEFINEHHNNLLIASPYTVIANKLLLISQHRITRVFLPINTPPPRV